MEEKLGAMTALVLGLVLMTSTAPTTSLQSSGVDDGVDRGDALADWAPLPEFVGRDDPAMWQVHEETGLHYRRTTVQERQANDWVAGSYLVELGPLQETIVGPATLGMLFPYNDTVTRFFQLELNGTEVIPSAVSHAGQKKAVVNSSQSPTNGTEVTDTRFFEYDADAPDGMDAYLITSDDGGFSGKAVIGDHVGSLLGPEDRWQLSDVPTPSGVQLDNDDVFLVQFILHDTAAARASGPGLDTPASKIDSGSTSSIDHDYAMFAEMKWCEDHENNWNDALSDLGWTVQDGFSATKASMDYVQNHCWFGDATTCDTDGGCSHHWWGHAYPYNGCNGEAVCYNNDPDHAWYDVDHARNHVDFPTLDVVNVIHAGPFNNVCGSAWNSNDGPDKAGAGASADWQNYGGCAPYVATHEVGHNFNAQHKRADDCTVMKPGASCRANHFSDENRNLRVDPCAEDSNCPRTNER